MINPNIFNKTDKFFEFFIYDRACGMTTALEKFSNERPKNERILLVTHDLLEGLNPNIEVINRHNFNGDFLIGKSFDYVILDDIDFSDMNLYLLVSSAKKVIISKSSNNINDNLMNFIEISPDAHLEDLRNWTNKINKALYKWN